MLKNSIFDPSAKISSYTEGFVFFIGGDSENFIPFLLAYLSVSLGNFKTGFQSFA